MIHKGKCNDGFIWNASIWEWECDKSCDVGEYLDYGNSQCSKKLIDQLVEEWSKDVNGNEMIYIVTLNDHSKVWNKIMWRNKSFNFN